MFHANGKGANGFGQAARRNGADKRAVQPARKQKAQRCICIQPLFHGGRQLFPDGAAGLFLAVCKVRPGRSDVTIRCEHTVRIIVPGREGAHFVHQAHKVFCLAGKHGLALPVAVKQRAYANWVPRGNQAVPRAVIQNAGKLGIQPGKHGKAIFQVQRKQQLTI